jgi:hypothetical protein
MTVYRDAAHCISRVMSIEIHDGTKKADWQRRYKPGFDDELPRDSLEDGLSPEERTLRRWRSITKRWLDEQVSAAHLTVETLLEEGGLLHRLAA